MRKRDKRKSDDRRVNERARERMLWKKEEVTVSVREKVNVSERVNVREKD